MRKERYWRYYALATPGYRLFVATVRGVSIQQRIITTSINSMLLPDHPFDPFILSTLRELALHVRRSNQSSRFFPTELRSFPSVSVSSSLTSPQPEFLLLTRPCTGTSRGLARGLSVPASPPMLLVMLSVLP